MNCPVMVPHGVTSMLHGLQPIDSAEEVLVFVSCLTISPEGGLRLASGGLEEVAGCTDEVSMVVDPHHTTCLPWGLAMPKETRWTVSEEEAVASGSYPSPQTCVYSS